MDLKTGYKLPRSEEEIKIGDVLSSSITHNVIVQWHEEKDIPIVNVMYLNDDIWFTLEEFLDAWKSKLTIKENINVFNEKHV